MEDLFAERSADQVRTIAERDQEIALLDAQQKELEFSREKLRRALEEKSGEWNLAQEEVDTLRVSML